MKKQAGIPDRSAAAPCAAYLHRRAEVLRTIRRFFDEQDFCEVRTPILSADTIVDRYVEPIIVTDPSLPTNHHGDRRYFLQTSPEFAMKRLLAAGMDAIYQITPVFRRGDRGRFHNVEFTMLEWYRTGDDYSAGMNLLAELIASVDPSRPMVVLETFRDVFEEYVGLNPLGASIPEFQREADQRGIAYPESFSATDDWIDLLFSELVQPHLSATIVYDFPDSQSQLARTRTDDGETVAERFELFLNGIEIANGYHELLDAGELRRRFEQTHRHRLEDGRDPLPVKSRLLEAMEAGLPPCSGCALGIERLLMVLFDADSIDEVLAFPIEIA